MSQNLVILVLSLLICGYDVYVAIRSGGHNVLAWILAALMAVVALATLRQLTRRPNA